MVKVFIFARPSKDLKKGQMVKINKQVGIAPEKINAGEIGRIQIYGEFEGMFIPLIPFALKLENYPKWEEVGEIVNEG